MRGHGAPEQPAAGRNAWMAATMCAALLLVFAILSYSAALTKSPTSDEPLHALGGYVHRVMRDFRINPEDPPLFGYWAALPNLSTSVALYYTLPSWGGMLEEFDRQQWAFTATTLFDTSENDGERFIQRSRFMFVLIGILLGALIAWWSWHLSGAAAAIIATTLFALDPNFLAHASLVKNDVMSSLMTLALAVSLWKFGRNGSLLWLAAIAGACGVGMNVKFSGVLCGPMILVALVIRAILPLPWNVLGRDLISVRQRLLVVPAACLVVAVVSYAVTWTSYGFRYAPTNDPNVRLDIDAMVSFIKKSKTVAVVNRVYDVPPEIERAQTPGLIADAVVWADGHRLVPQAWAVGFLYTYATTFAKPTFLLGTAGQRGVWYYFPLAVLFKTPTATLIAGLVAMASLWRIFAARMQPPIVWTLVCIGVPMFVYLESALTSGINIGIRHMLPMYPFVFVTIGVGMATLISRSGMKGYLVTGTLLIGLATESLAAYPNFIAFFNTPSGSRGGINLLGDSNLDWGQDLKLLARWQKEHADKKLYFAYFGTVYPAFYGINATMMPGGMGPGAQLPSPDEDCYIAISATILQGMYLPREFEKLYVSFRGRKPIAVLGGTIYVYDTPYQGTAAP